MDQPRSAVKLRLASQVADIHLERVRRRREVVSPNVVEDLLASEYLAGMKHEEFQQAELGAGQADRAVATAHLTGGWIQGETPQSQRGRPGPPHGGGEQGGAPQGRATTRRRRGAYAAARRAAGQAAPRGRTVLAGSRRRPHPDPPPGPRPRREL